MTDFSLEEALPLAAGLGLSEEQTQQKLSEILEWTGGHPYLTQRLCQMVAEQGMASSASKTDLDSESSQTETALNSIPALVVSTFLGETSEQDNNLQFVRDMLTRQAPDLTQVLSTYREVRREREVRDQEQSLIKSHLKLSGVVKREQGRLLVRNPIYKTVFDEKWIKEHLPINWARRLQQAAGIIAATLLLALIMSGLTVYAFVQQGEANKQADESRTQRNTAENAQKLSDRLRQSAEAQSLAFRAQTQTDPELALLLTIEAAQRSQSNKLDDNGGQVEAALRQTLSNYTPNIALRTSGNVNSVSFSPDGKHLLVAGYEGYARVFGVGSGKELMTVGGKGGIVGAAVYSPDGKYVATAGADQTVRLWDTTNWREFKVLQGHNGAINNLAISSDGKLVATASDEGTGRIWEVATGKELTVLRGHSGPVTAIEFRQDGNRVYTGGNDKTAQIWETATGKELKLMSGFNKPIKRILSSKVFTDITLSLAPKEAGLTEDQVWMVSDGVWRSYDLNLGGGIGWIPYIPILTGVIFSPDSKLIAIGGTDGRVRLWDSTSGKLVRTLEGHHSIVILSGNAGFSPDGQRLVAGSNDSNDNSAIVWDGASGKQLQILKGHTKSLFTARFSPDSKFIVTSSADGTARVWDTTTGASLAVLRGHSGPVRDASFSPDGKTS